MWIEVVTPVRLMYEGELVDADDVRFTSAGGGPPELLQLEDGTRIEFGHQVQTVFRLRDKKKEDGAPVFICAGQVKITVTPPVNEGSA
jgi:hypothetical protein